MPALWSRVVSCATKRSASFTRYWRNCAKARENWSEAGSNSTRPHDTPAAHGFEQTKAAGNNQGDRRPEVVIADHHSADHQDGPQRAADRPTTTVNVGGKEFLHVK